MRGNLQQQRQSMAAQAVEKRLVAAVQNHSGHLPIGAEEGGALQTVQTAACAVGAATDARGGALEEDGGVEQARTGGDVLGKVAHVVVLWVDVQLARSYVCHDRSVAVITQVVGSALLVEQEVPVQPTHRARLEVAEHVVCVPLSVAPRAVLQLRPLRPAVLLVRCLGGEEHLVGPPLSDGAQLLEGVARVPVECDAVEVLGRGRV
mmetsp:Transcript_39272/g.97041  ORF Transcript_39272/g.97041 Transcript_39272/m.97041 type:complete len:206 (+) Transcript_39272:490-1107(+)